MSTISGVTICDCHCFWCEDALEPHLTITTESRRHGTIHSCITCARSVGTEMIGESWQRQWDVKQIPTEISVRRGGLTFPMDPAFVEAFEIARGAEARP